MFPNKGQALQQKQGNFSKSCLTYQHPPLHQREKQACGTSAFLYSCEKGGCPETGCSTAAVDPCAPCPRRYLYASRFQLNDFGKNCLETFHHHGKHLAKPHQHICHQHTCIAKKNGVPKLTGRGWQWHLTRNATSRTYVIRWELRTQQEKRVEQGYICRGG